MQKLLLATDSFPYGKTEKNFVLPEITRLCRFYDITVISHADAESAAERAAEAKLPEGVKLVCFPRPVITLADKVRAAISYLFDRDGRQEMREIFSERKNWRERLYQSLSFWAQALSDQKKLRASGLLNRDEPIIYYSFWYSYFCYSMVREGRRYPNVKIITRTHGHDLYHERVPGGRQPLKHPMEKGLERIVFACEYGRSYYIDNVKGVHMDADRLRVCRLGTEPTERDMPDGAGEAWELVSCSNAVPLKRIDRIIDGLALIAERRIHWTHIGGGGELVRLQEYAESKLGAKKNIRYTFTGYIDDVMSYYTRNHADCFITTSSTEGGCPVSIQEAMAYGIPIIGTAVGGITEMITDNGILLSADPDAEEIAEAVETIAQTDGETLERMKAGSLRRWEADFDAGDSFQRMLAELRAL